MTDLDKPEFLKTVTAMAAMYHRDCPVAVIDLYFKALRSLSIEQVQAAVVSLLETSKFMPLPADIREAIEGPQPKTSPAERAWMRLIEMVKECHQCNHVEADDPCIAKALRVVFGGWDMAVRRIVFDGLDEIAQAVIRKDFCAAYETAIAEGVSTSGRSILRVPRGALLPGNSFMLGLVDRSGVRVLTGDRAYDWLNRAALPPAPATAALMAHQHEDD